MCPRSPESERLLAVRVSRRVRRKYLCRPGAIYRSVLHKIMWSQGCSRCAIAIAVYFSQLMSCIGYSVIIAIIPYEHLHWIPYNPFVAIKSSHSQSYHVNSPLTLPPWTEPNWIWRRNCVRRFSPKISNIHDWNKWIPPPWLYNKPK